MLVCRRAALWEFPFDSQPQHSAPATTRTRGSRELRVHGKECCQVLIAVEVNRAKAARSLSEVNGNVYLLNAEYRPIRFRFRGLKRPLDVRDQRLLRPPFTGHEEHILTQKPFKPTKIHLVPIPRQSH